MEMDQFYSRLAPSSFGDIFLNRISWLTSCELTFRLDIIVCDPGDDKSHLVQITEIF